MSEAPPNLLLAVQCDDLPAATEALANGDTARGWCSLTVALAHGASDAILALLLAHGADPNERASRGLTALHRALQRAANGADVSHAVRSLLDAGADVLAPDDDGLTALHQAARSGSATLFALVLDAASSRDLPPDLLDLAVRSEESFAKLGTLLARGASPDGVHALCLACGAIKPDAALRLIEAGATLNVADAAGATPLHHAVAAGHETLVDTLLSRGASREAKTKRAVSEAELRRGDTPIDVAERRARYLHLLASEALVRAATGRALEVGAVASRFAATLDGAEAAARTVCKRAGLSVTPTVDDVTAPTDQSTLARLAVAERIAALVGASLAPKPLQLHGVWKCIDVLDGIGPQRAKLELTAAGTFTATLTAATLKGTWIAEDDDLRLTTATGPLDARFDGISLALSHSAADHVTVFIFAPPAAK